MHGKLTKETIREGNIPPAQIAEGAGPGLPGWLVFVCVLGGVLYTQTALISAEQAHASQKMGSPGKKWARMLLRGTKHHHYVNNTWPES